MASLAEIDRDLDQIPVDASRLADVQKASRAKLALAAVDEELAALGAGASVPPRPVTSASVVSAAPAVAPPPEQDEAPPSGQIDVPDHVLASSELPAVLAITPPEEPAAPLSLDLDSGETGLDDPGELAREPTSASAVLPVEAPAPPTADLAPPTETRALTDSGIDDPNQDLASLLGDSDPMRDEGAAPLASMEIEPEPTMMFSAEDAERFSRPAPPMSDDEVAETSDVELDLDEEILELDDDAPAAEAAPRPRTQPPPPPRTAPPPPPGRPSEAPQGRGFLGKLLQRKPQ